MITAQQIRAARALLALDQKQLAEMAGVSLPTIQRMEASQGQVRGTVDTLVKVVGALEGAGIEIIGEHAPSAGSGRGVRMRETMEGASLGEPSSPSRDKPRNKPAPPPPART